MAVFLVRLMMIAVCTTILALSIRLLMRKLKFLGLSKARKDKLPKWSTQQRPTIGGLIFYAAFLFYNLFQDIPFFDFTPKKFGFFIAGTLAFLIGLWDDLKVLKPSGKLLLQVLVAIISIAFGFHLSITQVLWLDAIITFLLIIGLMNSVNMLDNMDASAAFGVLPFFVFCFLTGVEIGIAIYLIAALLAFLIYNFPPAKIYMGDSGSMLLGYTIALVLCRISSDGEFKDDTIGLVLQSVVLLLIPLADTFLVIIQRMSHNKSPMEGGKDHSTHHMHYAGLSERKIALVLLLSAAIQCAIAMAIYDNNTVIEKWLYSMIACAYCVAYFLLHYFNTKRNLKSGKYTYVHE